MNIMTEPHVIHVYRASKESHCTRQRHGARVQELPLIFEQFLNKFRGHKAAQQTTKITNVMETIGT